MPDRPDPRYDGESKNELDEAEEQRQGIELCVHERGNHSADTWQKYVANEQNQSERWLHFHHGVVTEIRCIVVNVPHFVPHAVSYTISRIVQLILDFISCFVELLLRVFFHLLFPFKKIN